MFDVAWDSFPDGMKICPIQSGANTGPLPAVELQRRLPGKPGALILGGEPDQDAPWEEGCHNSSRYHRAPLLVAGRYRPRKTSGVSSTGAEHGAAPAPPGRWRGSLPGLVFPHLSLSIRGIGHICSNGSICPTMMRAGRWSCGASTYRMSGSQMGR